MMASNSHHAGAPPGPTHRLTLLLVGLTLLYLLLLGVIIWGTDRRMRANFLLEAQLASAAVDRSLVQELRGELADKNLPAYEKLERALTEILQINTDYKYVYLMRQSPEGALILIDIQDDAREETAPIEPGTLYEDASPELLKLLADPQMGAFVEGPLEDVYGSWVSALLPLRDPDTGEAVAVFGIDIHENSWRTRLFLEVAPFGGLLLIFFIAFAAYYLLRKRPSAEPKVRSVSQRLLLPLLGALLVLLAAFLLVVLYWQKRQVDHAKLVATQRVQGTLETLLAEREKFLRAIAQTFTTTPWITQMLAQGDRQTLLQHYENLWESLRQEAGVDLFYLIDKNGRCVLRVHDPARYGDEVTDEIFLRARETGRMEAGVGLSLRGRPALRVSAPVWYQGQLVGYIEVASTLPNLLQELEEAGRVDLVATLDRENLRPEYGPWYQPQDPWVGDEFGSEVIFYASSQQLLPEILAFQHGKSHTRLPKSGADWEISRLPLRTSAGKDFGNLYVFLNTAASQREFRLFIGLALAVFGTVSVALVSSLYVTLRRTDQALLAQHEQLFAANQELAQQRVQAEELARKAEAATQAKSDFLAFMSHEIRNPLGGIIGLTSLLKESPLPSDAAQITGLIEKSAQDLLSLINNVLDYSRLEAGRMELEAIEFSVAELLRDAAALFQPTAAKKGLEFQAQLDPALPTRVWGDPTRLRQVLHNLLGNACKFTHHGRITLVARLLPEASNRATAAVCFEVHDTGVGIPADKLSQIFEKYRQADQSTAREFGGSGLGLAISRELVQRMGGELRVESTAGEGSTFGFSIPFSIQPPTSETPKG